MSSRTRRTLIGAGLGLLPGLLVIGAAVGIELWVESGGGLFGIVGILLAFVGAIVGAFIGAAKPETLQNPQLGVVLGAIPGMLALYVLAEFGIPVVLVGAWVGSRLALRAQRRATAQQPSNRQSNDSPIHLPKQRPPRSG